MKFNEIYVPVFEETKPAKRLLRADFGSRKVDLVCTECWHEFTKRIGPNTGSVKCPECDCNRVKPALSEITKKKLVAMKESIGDGDMPQAIQESLEVLDLLHGKTDVKMVKMMKEALAGLVSIERGLTSRSKELKKCISEGTGRTEFKDISTKLGHDLFKDDE